MFSRLAAQFLKTTLALLAALAVGGAWADYFWGDSAEGTWGTGFSGSSGNYVLNSAKDVTVNFDSSYSIASGVWIESGSYTVTFKGASTDVGLTMTGSADDMWGGGIHVGGWGGNGNLVIDGGSYTIPNALFVPFERKGDEDDPVSATFELKNGVVSARALVLGREVTCQGTATLSGGTFSTPTVYVDGGSGTLEFDGGTLQASAEGTLIASGVTVTVGANGGTIDTNGKAVTIASAITGSGTLTITGGGVATFTTAPTCGLKVENGVAVLPGNSKTGAIEIGAHGVLAFDLTGWTIANGTAYTLAWNVASLTIPAGETYADSIFTIGPDFTSTISYENNTIYATATGDATYTGSTANLRQIAIPSASAWVDNTAEWINGVTPNGASNSGTPGNTGYAYRRDIVVVPHDARILFWQSNHPDNITLVNRGATLTLTSWDSTESTLVIENLVNTGTIVNGEGGASGTTYAFNIIVNNTVTTGGTVTLSNGSALTFPAGSTFADISATTVKVTGTVTGTTVAADGTTGVGSSLFTLTGNALAFDNKTVIVSINSTDTAIHYTKDANGVYTAGKVYYYVGSSDYLPGNASDWANESRGTSLTSEGDVPAIFDTAIFDGYVKSKKVSAGLGKQDYNIVVAADMQFGARDRNGKYYFGSSIYSPAFVVKEGATAEIYAQQNQGGIDVYFYSVLKGSGTMVFRTDTQNDFCWIHGDTKAFTGTVDIRQGGTGIYGVYISNSSSLDKSISIWNVNTNGFYIYRSQSGKSSETYTPFRATNMQYDFGVLNAYISNSGYDKVGTHANLSFGIGEKIDNNSWLRGSWYSKDATYGGKVKWLAKTATFTQAVANAYEVDVMGGGNVYVEQNSTTANNFVPSVIKFLAYTDSENVVRGGGYLTLDSNNSAIAGDIVNAVAAAGDGETQVATGFNVEAVEGGVSADVTKSAVLNNAVGFNKKGAGTLTLSGAFTKLGMVNVTEGSLVIVATSALAEGTAYTCAADTACTISGTTYTFGHGVATFNSTAYPTLQSAVDAAVSAEGGTVTLLASVAEDVVIEAAGVSIVLGDYTITGTVTSSEDYDIVYDENTKTWTSSETANFIWCGGNGTSWSTPANWKKNAVPGETDKVIFPETTIEGGWVVALDSATTVAKITANGPVTFSGARIAVHDDENSHGVVGDAVITLGDDAGFDAGYLGTLTIDNALIISGTPDHPVIIKGSNSNNDGPTLNFNGNISGTGYLSTGGARSTVNFNGNNTAFRGTVSAPHDGVGGSEGRNYVYFANGNATSSQATWLVGMIIRSGNNYNFAKAKGDTYYFGSFSGNMRNNVDANYQNPSTFVFGETDDNFTLSYEGRSTESRRDYICKKGIGTMTFTGTNVRGYDLQNGVTELMTSGSLPSQTIKMNGGALKLNAAITVDTDPSEKLEFVAEKTATVDDGGEDRTFASAIGNDKSANFTKKGAGALTLAAPPTYTGTTKVEDGVLYVINGEYSLPLDSSTAEVTTDKEGYRKFVPASVAISAPTVVWGDDFAKVTVSAEVNSNYGEGGLSYNLKIGGNVVDGAVGSVNNGVVTFSDVNVSGLNLIRYGDVSVEVTASAGGSQAATSGPKNVKFADTIGWVNENYETTGDAAAAGGAWQTAVAYDATTHKAAVVDNRFSATNCTTGDVVTVTIDDVVYTSLSDLTSADTDAQGAVAVGGTEQSPKFMLLTKQGDTVGWYEAAGVTPVLETGVYDIVMTFDYNSNSKTYTVTVNGTPLTVGGVAAVPLAKAQTSVKDIDFLGAGSLSAINGVQYEGKMAIDQNGVKYATVDAALQANASVKGAVIKLLHGSATTSAEGWNFDSDTKTFVKKVIGLIFLAF
jgi:autotransporter-associated beta strand protein